MLDNLTDHENRIYDKLLVEMGRKEPYEEVRRLSILFRQHTDIVKNSFLFEEFKTFINNKLYFHLKSKEEFYDLDRFEDIYETLLKDFIEENIDADENDFIEEYINSQQEIINKTFKYSIEISDYKPLELMQFLKRDSSDEFIRGSKKKIEFLENRLYVLNASKTEVNEVNPYPLLFVSPDIYSKFIEYTEKHIIDYYLDYSYLKKRLQHEKLIHSTQDNEFMRILCEEMKLISTKNYKEYSVKNKLSSLKKSSSINRENNFNNIFDI
jgi:hypothetical protein